MRSMSAIRTHDIPAGRQALRDWDQAARALPQGEGSARRFVSPDLPRATWALAVRFSLYLLELRAPGGGVEVRVAPWGAVKVLDGPQSDPHNLTPPDVIELEPDVWLRLACGITSWKEEY